MKEVTLRQQFVMAALNGICSNPAFFNRDAQTDLALALGYTDGVFLEDLLGKLAVQYADAAMRAEEYST